MKEYRVQTFIMLKKTADIDIKLSLTRKKEWQKVFKADKDNSVIVKWFEDYAILGPCEYDDIFHAPDIETATEVSILVRKYGDANTKIWPDIDWVKFKNLMSDYAEVAE